MDIAHRIDIAMMIAGLKNQADLYRASGVAQSSLARILKGGQPSIENLTAIALACHVTIDYLVNGSDSPNTDAPEISLVYVTLEELKLITQFREANAMGKTLIKSAGVTAPKQLPVTDSDQP